MAFSTFAMRRPVDGARVGLPLYGTALFVLVSFVFIVMPAAAQVGALRVGMSSPTAASLGKFAADFLWCLSDVFSGPGVGGREVLCLKG